MATFRKAITAALATLVGSLGTAAVAGDVDGKAFLACVGAGLVAGAGVYAVPNKAVPS